jgi:hypothetical protein
MWPTCPERIGIAMTRADAYNASIEYFKNYGLGTFGVWYIGEK